MIYAAPAASSEIQIGEVAFGVRVTQGVTLGKLMAKASLTNNLRHVGAYHASYLFVIL
jgi:hypothetical protein